MQIPSERRLLFTKLHGVTPQKHATFTSTAIRTSYHMNGKLWPSFLSLTSLGQNTGWYEKLQLHHCEGHRATLDHYGIRNWLTRDTRSAVCYNKASLTTEVQALPARLNLGHYQLFALTGATFHWFIYMISTQNLLTITDNDHETYLPLTTSDVISVLHVR